MPNNRLKSGTSPILYTQENPDGWFLEDLLEQAVKDLSAKEEFMLANYEHGPAMDNYLKSNKRISELMQEAANLQKESIMFARENPLTRLNQVKEESC